MPDFYRFDTKQQAEAMLNVINSLPVFPIKYFNAATGEPAAEDKAKAEKWSEVIEFTDGKFGFPAIADEWLSILKITLTNKTQLETTYSPKIEKYDPSWMPEKEYTPSLEPKEPNH